MNYLAALPSELREEIVLFRDEVRIEVGLSCGLDDIRGKPAYPLKFTFGQTKVHLIYCTLDGLDRFLCGSCPNLAAFVNMPDTMHWLIRRDRAMVIRTTCLYGGNRDLIDIPEDVAGIVEIKLKRILRMLTDSPRLLAI